VGVPVSRAGLLREESGALVPAYPVAFSLWTGIPLAVEAPDRKKMPPPAKKASSPKDEGPGGKGPEHRGKEGGEDGEGGEGSEHRSLVDPDGDISIVEVVADLLRAEGYEIPEGVDKDNFLEHLYQTMMECIKRKGGGGIEEGLEEEE